MAYRFVDVEEAANAPGLRMVVVSGIPSPWSESAKGLFHVKKLEWLAVRLDYESAALKAWAKQRSGPVAFWNSEPPRDRWIDIVMLAERIAPQPALLPADPAQRALAIGLSHEIMGEGGLCWSRRLRLVHAGVAGAGGFAPPPVAEYIGRKYGYTPQTADAAATRVPELLDMLAKRLKSQHAAGSKYFVGNALTATDIHAAAALALFRPLPQEVCNMEAGMRNSLEFREPGTDAALDEVLLAHREMMYREHLSLPLGL
jgi:glutathione S-transferase